MKHKLIKLILLILILAFGVCHLNSNGVCHLNSNGVCHQSNTPTQDRFAESSILRPRAAGERRGASTARKTQPLDQAYLAARHAREIEFLTGHISSEVGRKVLKRVEPNIDKMIGLLSEPEEQFLEKVKRYLGALTMEQAKKILGLLQTLWNERRLDPKCPEFDLKFWIYKVFLESDTTEIEAASSTAKGREEGATGDEIYEMVHKVQQIDPDFDVSDLALPGQNKYSLRVVSWINERVNKQVFIPRGICILYMRVAQN